MKMIDKQNLFKSILDCLNLDNCSKLNDEFNLFEYDSFTKMNLIIIIESFSDNENLLLDALVKCNTYSDIIDLSEKMYKEVHNDEK